MTDRFATAFEAAKAHARAEFPKESCGLIVEGEYIACDNIADSPDRHREGDVNCACQLCSFELPSRVFIAYAGRIDFVVHSHPDGPFYPSAADMEAQLTSNVPWAIIALDAERVGDPVMWGDQLPIEPLIGRSFMHGVRDCYSLIRDCYRLGKDELASQGVTNSWPYPPIVLPPFPREDGWWGEDIGQNLYDDNYASCGFVEIPIEEAKPGDIFFAKIRSDKFNHAGLLVSSDLILHHLPLRLSRREPAGLWGRQAGRWIRYMGAIHAA